MGKVEDFFLHVHPPEIFHSEFAPKKNGWDWKMIRSEFGFLGHFSEPNCSISGVYILM